MSDITLEKCKCGSRPHPFWWTGEADKVWHVYKCNTCGQEATAGVSRYDAADRWNKLMAANSMETQEQTKLSDGSTFAETCVCGKEAKLVDHPADKDHKALQCECGMGAPRWSTNLVDAVSVWNRHVLDVRAMNTKIDGPPHDPVNHPKHYTSHPSGIECIQVTRHMGFNLGNAVKYLWRADLKNGIEDLEKAAWYIKDEIEKRKKQQEVKS